MKRIHLSYLVALLSTLLISKTAFAWEPSHENDVVELTLRHQEGIHLDSTLYHEIDSTLTLARAALDTLAGIHTFPQFQRTVIMLNDPNSVFINTWGQGQLWTEDTYIDSLGREYGLESIGKSHYSTWYDLWFSRPAQMQRLAELYQRAPQFDWAEASYSWGDGDDILLKMRSDGHYYGFSIGWGDCPAGCINRYWWYVHVADGNATFVLERDRSDPWEDPAPFWNMSRRGRTNTGRYATAEALIDSITESNRWWIREHAIQFSLKLLCDGPHPRDEWFNTLRNGLFARISDLYDAYIQVRDENDPDLALLAEEALATYLPPYTFHLKEPEGVHFAEEFVGRLVWGEAFPSVFADSFHYEVRINDDSVGTHEVDSNWVELADLQSALNLQRDTLYTWEVIARSSLDSFRWLAAPEQWSFKITDSSPPGAFHLILPADGDTVTSIYDYQAIQMSWTDAAVEPFTVPFTYTVHAQDLDAPITWQSTEVYDTTESMICLSDLRESGVVGLHHIQWWVIAKSSGGYIHSVETWTFCVEVSTDDAPESRRGLPETYEIASVHPNPFNPTLTVVVGLPQPGELQVAVFNIMGRRVITLSDQHHQVGYHTFKFYGSSLASGVYFVHAMVPGKLNQVKKVMLMK